MKFFKTVLLILIAVSLLVAGWRLLTSASRTGKTGEVSALPGEAVPAPAGQPPVAESESATPVSLVAGGSETDVPWTSRTPAAKRVRKIEIDPAWMTPEPSLKNGDFIELALFNDAVFKARVSNVTRYPNGAVGLTAHLEGGEHAGTVFLSYCEGQMRVSIEVPGGEDYYVRYNPETGEHCVIEVDREKTIVRECGDIMIPPPNDARDDDAVAISGGPAASRAGISIGGPAAPLALFSDGEAAVPPDMGKAAGAGVPPISIADAPVGSTVVDVMIVYTPAALAIEGNAANMNANIAAAMQRANEAHTNSNTQIYLNLVHSELVSYTESGNDSTDLTRLTLNDGYMDNVHTLRDTYGADFVCLFSDTATVGGIGWLLTSPGGDSVHAFCLAFIGQTDTGYTVVHEWGHNMGCSHSKTQTVQPWSSSYHLRSYSAGWQWADTKPPPPRIGYCSVMCYEDVNNDGTNDHIRVGRFSNPNISYTGNSSNPTGHASDGDNARAMREMKAVYVAYRDPSSPPPPPLPPIPPPITSSVTNYPYSESFESGYGYWSYGEGPLEWTRQMGETPSLETGPADAFDGGSYMFTEATGHDLLTALLRAAFDFRTVSAPEIQFSYHMYGADMGTLYLEASTNGTIWNTLWSRSGNQGDQWVSTNVSLQAYGGRTNIQLRFRGITPDFSSLGDMALDLIMVSNNDSDGDGLPNDWEVRYSLSPVSAAGADGASGDPDSDGLTNLQEYTLDTNPRNRDTDGDGVTDGTEIRRGTDPLDPASKPPMAMPWLSLLLE